MVVVEGLKEGEDVRVCVSECVKCPGRRFLSPLLVCVLSWGRFYAVESRFREQVATVSVPGAQLSLEVSSERLYLFLA